MFLDTTSKVLELILGANKTTNDCEFTADYVDTVNGSTFAPGGTIGLSNGNTLVTVVAAPAASTQRSIRAFTFYNADTVNTTVTVRIFDGTNRRRIVVRTLTPGQSLVFTPEAGWSLLPSTNGQIPGTATNDNAAAGNIGEYATSGESGTTNIPTSTTTDVQTLGLTAGDWDVWASARYNVAGGPAITEVDAGLNTVSATLPGNSGNGARFTTLGDYIRIFCGMKTRVSFATSSTVYLSMFCTFTGGGATVTGQGWIGARRMR